jgi:predicted AlkP superfamily pyrophosphatase or phosphodiesterase
LDGADLDQVIVVAPRVRRRTMKIRLPILLSTLAFMLLGITAGPRAQKQDTGTAARRIIIFVWDGLRADDLTPEIAPNYFALARSGVVFADHHAVYPTITMMNSASIATGAYPGVHGFYGNVVYAPSAKGRNAVVLPFGWRIAPTREGTAIWNEKFEA